MTRAFVQTLVFICNCVIFNNSNLPLSADTRYFNYCLFLIWYAVQTHICVHMISDSIIILICLAPVLFLWEIDFRMWSFILCMHLCWAPPSRLLFRCDTHTVKEKWNDTVLPHWWKRNAQPVEPAAELFDFPVVVGVFSRPDQRSPCGAIRDF